MKKIMERSPRYTILCGLLLISGMVHAQFWQILGPSPVNVGSSQTYTFEMDDAFFTTANWTVTSGTVSTSSLNAAKTKATATIQWTSVGTGTITLKSGTTTVGTRSIQVNCGITAPTSYQVYDILDDGPGGTPVPLPSTFCQPVTIKIKAITSQPGTVRWYAAATGGSPLFEGLTFTPPSAISTTTTYYMSGVYSGCESTGARTPATVTILPAPGTPTITQNHRCGAGAVTLTGTPGTGGTTLQWFTQPSTVFLAATGNSFATPAISSNTNYYAASYNSTTGCVSALVPVVAEIVSFPPYPTGGPDAIIYGSGTMDIGVQPGGAADQVRWYDSETAPTPFFTGLSYTTPMLTASRTYYVTSYQTSKGCETVERRALAVTVSPIIVPASVRVDNIRVKDIKAESGIQALTASQKTTVVTHFDGLMRQKQQIVLQGSPQGGDVVKPGEFDMFGFQSTSYLPYVTAAGNGNFRQAYKAEQLSFYATPGDAIADDSMPYAVSKTEYSPMARPTEQGGVGAAYQPGTGHTQRITYGFNTGATSSEAEEVRIFRTDGTNAGYYAANTLSREEYTDADGNKQLIFKDKAGRVLVKKQQLDASINGGATVAYLQTYYVYDDFGNVRDIISPKGIATLRANGWSLTQSRKDQFVHSFVYDARGRLVEKKVPGQAVQYLVYDKLNRLVLTQDGLMRADKKWTFMKYDQLGRVVQKGIYTNTTTATRVNMQTLVDGLYTSTNTDYPENTYFEDRGTTQHGYTNVSFPKENADHTALEVWSVQYYGSYDFDYNGTNDYAYNAQVFLGQEPAARMQVRTLATGGKRIIPGTTTWLYTYFFYDRYGRVIQLRGNNHLSAAVDNLKTTVYDFEGKVLATHTYHNAGSGGVTTVVNRFAYDDGGRLIKVWQNNNNAGADQLVAQYVYNALGQLIDKKLHNTSGTDFLQSVDYRYTLKGQLASINNAQLTTDDRNDDANDYFGLEMLYGTTESGLGNSARYNGSVSAMKWKGPGTTPGASDQKAYAYDYFKSGSLKSASSKANGGSGWTQEIGALNEVLAYDHNGNITALQRNHRKHTIDAQNLAISYDVESMDNLTYTYDAGQGDRLGKVTDAATATGGFSNGTSGTVTDYTYDVNGNVLSDKNKDITAIVYNYFGKPTRVDFQNGRHQEYIYDAVGTRLTTKDYNGDTLKNTTDYVNGFVYENGGLQFFGSPEGRVVKQGSTLEYQYAIVDHLGNTRVVFSSVAPAPNVYTATFENPAADAQVFQNIPNALPYWAPSAGGPVGTKAVQMNQNVPVGPAKGLRVYPGDEVDMEVWTYYTSGSGYGSGGAPLNTLIAAVAGAFGGVPGGTGESGHIFEGVSEALTTFGSGGSQGNDAPGAYLNYLLYDKDYNILDMGYQPATGHNVKQKIGFPTIKVKEAGYIFVYLSYESESNLYVQFDDLKITHRRTNIVQYNEYYPFGLQTAASWTRAETVGNRFLFNAGSELSAQTGWYDMPLRSYDPVIGRMLQVDPMATAYASWSGYNYALNKPTMVNDPTGGTAEEREDEYDYKALNAAFAALNAAFAESADFNGYSSWSNNFSRRIGPGSGNHWTDGMGVYNDWTSNGGSDTYRSMKAAGAMDVGGKQYFSIDGKLYRVGADGGHYEPYNYTGWYYEVEGGALRRKPIAVISYRYVPSAGNGEPNAIPDEGTSYTGFHSSDYDIVREHQIKHTNFGYIETTRVVTITYGEGKKHKIEKYGYRTKSYYEYGTQQQWDNSPYINTILGPNFKIGERFQDEIQMTVNNHLRYDYYTDWIYYKRSHLNAVSSPNR